MKILAISSLTAGTAPAELQPGMHAEIAQARRSYLDGFIEQAYMGPTYEHVYLLLRADSLDRAEERLRTYPNVAAGLISFDLFELVGLPAVALAAEVGGSALPSWWP